MFKIKTKKTNYPVQNIQILVDSTVESAGESSGKIISILKKRIEQRCPVKFVSKKPDIVINLAVDETIGGQGFRIEQKGENSIYITGDGMMGLLYGVGKYLHSSRYTTGGFISSDWRGTSIPTGIVRGIQLDTHFCNFYHMASAEELTEYVEDLALWGINYLDVVFPLIDLLNWDDPEVEKIMGQISSIYKAAKSLGIKVGLEIVANQDFVNRREEFKATPNIDTLRRRRDNGNNICPNSGGAMEYILKDTHGRAFELFKEKGVMLDFLCFWPYDEGGCGCEKCFPWGGNGYLKSSRKIAKLAKTHFPDLKIILSTWLFDTPDEGEWKDLAKSLEERNDWVDYILADSHEDFPEYPLKYGVPGNLPLLNYPEISMWKLHPWGGYGANPLIDRFEMLWDQVKDAVSGGIAYSEGIFDDINKIVVSQFYWDTDTTARKTMEEYISYEYSHTAVDDVLKILELIEKNHVVACTDMLGRVANTRADIDSAKLAFTLAKKVDESLPLWAKKAWRWRILFIRTLLDVERYEGARKLGDQLNEKTEWGDVRWGDIVGNSETGRKALEELIEIFHSKMDADDTIHPMFQHVRPPLW